MKPTITKADLLSWDNNASTWRELPENWSGTALDMLRLEIGDPIDRIWMACHVLDERTNRLFAVWCARQGLALLERPDSRLGEAIDMAERFANGLATLRDMEVARENANGVAEFSTLGVSRPVGVACAMTCSPSAREAVYAAANLSAWAAEQVYGSTTTWRQAGKDQIKRLIQMIEEQP